MKQKTSVKKLSVKLKQVFLILAGLFAISNCVMAQTTHTIQSGDGLTLPCMPPSYSTTNMDGPWDQEGIYPAGSINTLTYYSSAYGANEQLMVYTPPGYDSSKKYGVIYCYQGISTGIDTIFDDWCVYAGGLEDNLLGRGLINPVIIVAVDDQINDSSPSAD